jgi:hypothetical protein
MNINIIYILEQLTNNYNNRKSKFSNKYIPNIHIYPIHNYYQIIRWIKINKQE